MILQAFGEQIKRLRKETGLSQEKFALTINMDRTYYSALENGKHNVTLLNIEKIAKGFNVSISELFYNCED